MLKICNQIGINLFIHAYLKYYIKLEKKPKHVYIGMKLKIDIQYHSCNNLFPYLAVGAEKTKRVCKISFEFFACSVLFYFKHIGRGL